MNRWRGILPGCFFILTSEFYIPSEPVLYQQRAASTFETTTKTRHRNNFFAS
jgi:hypothetical protein